MNINISSLGSDQCIWCGSKIIFGRKVRRRSVENVFQEIELLRRRYNVDAIWFIDDTFTISPDATSGNISRIRSVYIDLPTGATLNINISSLGSDQSDINSGGNEAGSIIFRDGIPFSQDITITVTGTPNTPYSVRMVTDVETPEVQKVEIINFPTTEVVPIVQEVGISGLLIIGLAVGLVYAVYKSPKSDNRQNRIT